MSKLADFWQTNIHKIDALSIRERVIVCGTIIIGFFIVAMIFAIEPLLERRSEMHDKISKIHLTTAELESSKKILEIEYGNHPNEKPRARLRELTHQLRRIEGDIQNKSQHLVPARQTAEVLQEMLKSQDSLYLKSLVKLAPIAIPITDKTDQSASTKAKEIASVAKAIESSDVDHVKVLMAVVENSDPFLKQLETQANVYKHGVKMEIEGSFLDVLEYLTVLENMNWKVYWKSFHYTSESYPKGKASFVIETLGFENGWIGV